MKNLLIAVLLLIGTSSFGQNFEVKASPLATLLFEGFHIDGEYLISDHSGVEVDVVLNPIIETIELDLLYKIYFNETGRAKGFNIFPYIQLGGISDLGIGFGGGYKKVAKNNVVFEASLGVGRGVKYGYNFYSKISVGYRFQS